MRAQRRETAGRWLNHLYNAPKIQDSRAQEAMHSFMRGPGDKNSLARTLAAMMEEVAAQVRKSSVKLETSRAEVMAKRNDNLAAHRDEVVEFLSAAQPGALTDLARQVLREHQPLLEKLEWTMAELNSRLLEVYLTSAPEETERESAPKSPAVMDRVEILKKVLEINPHLRVGTQTAEIMTENLLSSIRDSRKPPRFSDEKFLKVFRGMLGELEQDVNRDVAAFSRDRRILDDKERQLQDGLRERIVQFLVAASPGPLTAELKFVLQEFADVLGKIGVTLRGLDRTVRERSASLDI